MNGEVCDLDQGGVRLAGKDGLGLRRCGESGFFYLLTVVGQPITYSRVPKYVFSR